MQLRDFVGGILLAADMFGFFYSVYLMNYSLVVLMVIGMMLLIKAYPWTEMVISLAGQGGAGQPAPQN